jgi:hypothetical protein
LRRIESRDLLFANRARLEADPLESLLGHCHAVADLPLDLPDFDGMLDAWCLWGVLGAPRQLDTDHEQGARQPPASPGHGRLSRVD